jgi:aconitate hydratase
MSIFDSSVRYAEEGTPLMVFAGQDYGAGSSRDWAAKGTRLLGVRAVIACSFERIHRSNPAGMGVLPLQFEQGASPERLGLDGSQKFDLGFPAEPLTPRLRVLLQIRGGRGPMDGIPLTLRLDTPLEVEHCLRGGILPYVFGLFPAWKGD